MKTLFSAHLVLAALASITAGSLAAATAPPPTLLNSIVSSAGSDLNPCTLLRPCATLAMALSKTAPGGEIDALTSGEFGPVTIDRGITIDGNGFIATITLTSSVTAGITIAAGTTDRVVLRGLTILGGAVTGPVCESVGSSTPVTVPAQCGIALTGKVGYLTVQDVSVNNVATGIVISPTGDTTNVSILNTTITNTPAVGLEVLHHGQLVNVRVSNVTISVPSGADGIDVLAQSKLLSVQVDGCTITSSAPGTIGNGVMAQDIVVMNLQTSTVQGFFNGVEALLVNSDGGTNIYMNGDTITNNTNALSFHPGSNPNKNTFIYSYGNNLILNNGSIGTAPIPISFQ